MLRYTLNVRAVWYYEAPRPPASAAGASASG